VERKNGTSKHVKEGKDEGRMKTKGRKEDTRVKTDEDVKKVEKCI
jgi:hypothetical protein